MTRKTSAVLIALALFSTSNFAPDARAQPPGGGGIGSCQVCDYGPLAISASCEKALFGGAKDCWIYYPPLSNRGICRSSGECTVRLPGLVTW